MNIYSPLTKINVAELINVFIVQKKKKLTKLPVNSA
jgi:hypothetical protein